MRRMSRDQPPRKAYFSRDPRNRDRDRDRDRDWNRPDYRNRPMGRKSRSPPRIEHDKRRSRSPRKNEKDNMLDDNILSEISKLPEPSELWDNQNQFQEGGYPPPPQQQQPPPPYPPEGVSTNPPYGSNYQPSYSGIYDDFPPVASAPSVPPALLPPDIATWNQMSLPPPPDPAPPPFVTNPEDQMKKEAAIESEMRHQKAALSKQREDYMKKAGILKKELDTLKDQRNELRGDSKRSPSPDTKRFLKENTKLQLEIQNKLKTINNVVDMLNGIIGEEAQELHESDESPDRGSKRKSRSPSANQKFNYVYYDPEMHWCRVCNEFPPTAKDYLNHLHSPAHHKMAAAHMEAPWHTVSGINEGFPSFPSAPTKRTPIKGLQFFVPSTAWYCKLCDQFIGDLHCASAHLKSVTHSKNYTNFVEQNPHWETDWMSDRQKSFEKARASAKNKPEEKPQQYAAHTITFNKDGFHTKKKDSPPPQDEKKKKDKKKKSKKKRSSSSSSSSNSSSSDSEPVKKKKKKKDKSRGDADDKTLTDWITSIQTDRLNNSDRKLLDTLKSRMKMDKTEDKRRSPERSSHDKRRESEVRESRSRETRERDRDRDRERERDRDRDRDRRDESRRRDDDDRRHDRDRSCTPRAEPKKPEIRKMPFIGKMPVYKHLGRNSKTEDQKKEEEKKKEEDEASKKRREEMDAEIQKKVAEFKEKIAKAQLERQQQAELPPPAVALPTALGGNVPPAYIPPAPTPAPLPQPVTPAPPSAAQPPALPKDFQDALDIIFPSADVKPDMSQQDIFSSMSGLAQGFPMGLGGVMPPFPPFLQPQMPPQMMMGFDINASLFPRPQLYDAHVPLVSSPKMRHNNKRPMNKNTKKNNHNQNQNQNQNKNNQNKNENNGNQKTKAEAQKEAKENGEAAKKKEEMDDLAMLGIETSDVGAGI